MRTAAGSCRGPNRCTVRERRCLQKRRDSTDDLEPVLKTNCCQRAARVVPGMNRSTIGRASRDGACGHELAGMTIGGDALALQAGCMLNITVPVEAVSQVSGGGGDNDGPTSQAEAPAGELEQRAAWGAGACCARLDGWSQTQRQSARQATVSWINLPAAMDVWARGSVLPSRRRFCACNGAPDWCAHGQYCQRLTCAGDGMCSKCAWCCAGVCRVAGCCCW